MQAEGKSFQQERALLDQEFHCRLEDDVGRTRMTRTLKKIFYRIPVSVHFDIIINLSKYSIPSKFISSEYLA